MNRTCPACDLSVEAVERGLATVWVGRPFEMYSVVSSTNDLVFDRAAAGASPGLAIAADAQSAGRGRRGRSFESKAGLGLWTSVLLRSPADAARAPRLGLVVALAVAEAIGQECEGVPRVAPRLKWPNDVLLEGRKVAGILLEARTTGHETVLVAGIGINVHHRDDDFAPELRGIAGSLRGALVAAGAPSRGLDRALLAARLFAALERRLDAEARGAFDLQSAFAERDALAGRAVSLTSDDGSAFAGIADGIEGDGRLRLRLGDGSVVKFRHGEATLRSL